MGSLERGHLPKWATNLIRGPNNAMSVHSSLYQVRLLPLCSQFTVALCEIVLPHKIPDLTGLVSDPGVIESLLFPA